MTLIVVVPGPSRLAHGDDVWSVVGPDDDAGHIEIRLEGEIFATYSFRDEEIPRPYFANIVAPGGARVTRNHPPEASDPRDHATLHPGLWLAFGDISGNDYWRLRATVQHVRFVESPSADGDKLRFAVENRYLDRKSQETVCREICQYELSADDHGVLLVWDSTFQSDAGDFYFGDQEELGLGVRLATPIAVKSNKGGRILNSNGQRNEEHVWGKQADWCDYSGTLDGEFVGVMLMPHPGNFRKCWYHARDYGFVAANPFGRNAFTGGEKSKVHVRQGEAFRLRYGVYFHWNDTEGDFAPDRVYQGFVSQRY